MRAGMLLVATPGLLDPNFADTVVLMLEVDGDGALGVVLNRPSPVPVAEVLDPWADACAEPEVLFRGGPGQHRGRPRRGSAPRRRTTRPSASGESRGSGTTAWAAWSAWSTSTPRSSWWPTAWPGCASSPGTPGWGAEQLAAEIEEGSWYVVPGEVPDVFRVDPTELKRDVLRRQPGELAWHSTRPVDPDLN